jgi:predicted dehydrogenase
MGGHRHESGQRGVTPIRKDQNINAEKGYFMEVKIGLIGCGNMGSGLIKNCSKLDNVKVTGVTDSVAEKAVKLADELGVQAFNSQSEMLESPDLDAVIVAVPNFLHAETSITAAKCGKHVFCEKPMALTVAECDKMIQAAKDSNVKLMIGQVLRYLPVFNKMKEIIDSGVLSDPFSIYISRLSGGSWGNPQHWRMKSELCGGVLYEVSVHELDYMRYICGEVDSVSAYAGNYLQSDNRDYEDTIHVNLHFKNGGIGTLITGQCSSMGGYEGKIHCKKGTIHFDNGRSLVKYKPFDGEIVDLGSEDMKTEPGIRRELRYFIESVVEDKEPAIPGEEGRKNIEVIQAAYISVKEGHTVKLPIS